MDDPTIYVDGVHLNQDGYERLGRVIYEGMWPVMAGTPGLDTHTWTDPNYRYYRLRAEAYRVLQVSEIQWWRAAQLTGTQYSGDGGYIYAPSTLAFDGNNATSYIAKARGSYLYIDLGSNVPSPSTAYLSPASIAGKGGETYTVSVINLGSRTIKTVTIGSNSTMVSITSVLSDKFTVLLSNNRGACTLTVTLSDNSTLTLGIDVSPIGSRTGYVFAPYRSIPKIN
jgi:hypothetical protein